MCRRLLRRLIELTDGECERLESWSRRHARSARSDRVGGGWGSERHRGFVERRVDGLFEGAVAGAAAQDRRRAGRRGRAQISRPCIRRGSFWLSKGRHRGCQTGMSNATNPVAVGPICRKPGRSRCRLRQIPSGADDLSRLACAQGSACTGPGTRSGPNPTASRPSYSGAIHPRPRAVGFSPPHTTVFSPRPGRLKTEPGRARQSNVVSNHR